jgi:nucleoid-associated protein
MSLSVKHLVLHSLIVDDEGKVALKARQQETQMSPDALELVEDLHLTYNSKSSKGFGYFSPSEGSQALAEQLAQHRQGELEFIPFTIAAGDRLIEQLVKFDLIEQGILMFALYEFVGSDYLQIMVLENKQSPSVNDALEVTASHYLETSSIQLAARIELTEMERNPESHRYVSYIKGRAGRKISDFFVEFLGCVDGLDVKQQNAVLMSAVDEYCQVNQLDVGEKVEYRKQVKSYCDQQLKEGEEIQVKALSDALPTADGDGDFYQFAAQSYPLEEQFPVDRSALKKLTKYFGQGKGVTVSFDQQLLGERVFYDANTDTLTIQGIPPNLKEQLRRES